VNEGQTVLVVDDDERLVTLVAEMVTAVGYRALKATGPREAVDVFESADRQVDVLLTDFQMPGWNGEELIGSLRKKTPGLPAVIMTGYADLLSRGLLSWRSRSLSATFNACSRKC
jgi:CheY-like chemotaxis protein